MHTSLQWQSQNLNESLNPQNTLQYHTLTGELWGVYCDEFGKIDNSKCYNGTALYMVTLLMRSKPFITAVLLGCSYKVFIIEIDHSKCPREIICFALNLWNSYGSHLSQNHEVFNQCHFVWFMRAIDSQLSVSQFKQVWSFIKRECKWFDIRCIWAMIGISCVLNFGASFQIFLLIFLNGMWKCFSYEPSSCIFQFSTIATATLGFHCGCWD